MARSNFRSDVIGRWTGAGVISVAWILALHPSIASAQSDVSQRAVAILNERCVSCHGESKQESDLRLDTGDGLLRGGAGGAVFEIGASKDSELLLRVISDDSDERMPPEGDRLTEDQIQTLRAWIDAGAKWPVETSVKKIWSDDRLSHWAWQSIAQASLPTPADEQGWVRNEIDRFILDKLLSAGLRPAAPADRTTLIRRLSFDLIGLPPTSEEIRAFVEDSSPDAYEKLVDRLLNSPRYGERWARHWLDVVHYADTHGYDKDQPRPNAWPYRDYVIRAFNADKPYAQFVAEQIAGDVLWPGTQDGIEATGLLAAGPWDLIGHAELPESKIDGQIARHLDRDNMVATVLGTFCSVTVHCAQCHDHKFDPISQEDYYSLQAVFSALDRADRVFYLDAEAQRQADQLSARIADVQAQLDAVQKARSDETAAAADETSDPSIDALKSELSNVQSRLAGIPGRHAVFCGTVHTGTGNFVGTGATGGEPRRIHVLNRGNVQQPRDEARPGALGMLSFQPDRFGLPEGATEGQRRIALSEWIVDAQNPLTWRSIVNRVWQQHFGTGIVESANDLGRMGGQPSHPELLDWLAADFRDHGGSLKRLHKQIVMSATYQQNSANATPEMAERGRQIDAENRLLWRQNRRKLDAESIHDAVLTISGKLDLAMGGPGYQDFVIERPEHSPHYEYDKADPRDPKCFRRAVYRFVVRSQTEPFMTCLDCADPSVRVAKRNESASPLQALALLNNRLTLTQAEYFAERLERNFGSDTLAAVEAAAWMCWGRGPTERELELLRSYAQSAGLTALCRAMFNSNEFAFVD